MTDHSFDNIKNTVKLVIWDLDETFWKGTLSEEGIEPRSEMIALVRTLADRGIMSSICSKNDFGQTRAKLEELGIWDMFVFPHIDWTPKGQAIVRMLETMGLRDENTLFLDDNHMNLEEAKFFNPRLMCVDGTLDLAGLADLPQLQGKDDRSLSRLRQYKVMEDKERIKTSGTLSNAEFLQQSDIKVSLDYDLDANWDRVLELINRTNQLNFTKKRAETPEQIAALKDLLRVPGAHAGLVSVTDRFGDYGTVGFFLMIKRSSGTYLEHFAFSCRTLNMGVEQFIYERLEKPRIVIAQPVANGLDVFPVVDWITERIDDEEGHFGIDRRLCLVGGCDLLQMSFYCGSNRDEFVNIVRNGTVVRYDDVGFLLNDRKDRTVEFARGRLETWTLPEMKAFDKAVSSADLIILSLYQSAAGQHFFTFGGTEFGGRHLIHLPAQAMRQVIASENAIWFAKNYYHRPYTLSEKLDLVEAAYKRVLSLASSHARVILINTSEQGDKAQTSLPIRSGFNALNRTFAATHERAVCLDIDTLLAPEDFVSSDHYTRMGYFKMAKFINEMTDTTIAAA